MYTLLRMEPLYGRKDFEKLTGKRYAYLKGINAHSEMALYVDTFEEVDAQYQYALQNGAVSLLEPTTEPWGQRTCFIADPEGNVIEIGSWNKPYGQIRCVGFEVVSECGCCAELPAYCFAQPAG